MNCEMQKNRKDDVTTDYIITPKMGHPTAIEKQKIALMYCMIKTEIKTTEKMS